MHKVHHANLIALNQNSFLRTNRKYKRVIKLSIYLITTFWVFKYEKKQQKNTTMSEHFKISIKQS
jgi:hypothetical protein